jgi:AraC-like DNA-binding protein
MKPALLIISIFTAIFPAFSLADDSTCQLFLVNPKPFTVIETKIYRLKAELDCSTEKLDSLTFYANYAEYGHKRETRDVRRHIKTLTSPPFEYVWDCSNIPDQDFWCARVSVVASLKNNKTLSKGGPVAFDRNPDLPDIHFVSWYNSKNLVIDGNFKEWVKKDSMQLNFSDNTLTAFSNWNRKGIYFAVFVKDQNIINTYGKNDLFKLYRHDNLQLRFDPRYIRSQFQDASCRIINITPNSVYGMSWTLLDTAKGELLIRPLSPSFDFFIDIHGSLNNETDADTGYSNEIFIPWKDLGLEAYPQSGKMGFNLTVTDTDDKRRESMAFSWAGVYSINCSNPTEWGTIILTKKPISHLSMFLVGFLIAALIVGGLVIAQRLKKGPRAEIIKKPSSPFQNSVLQYLENHYKDSNLEMQEFAQALNLNKAYFRQKFKKEFSINFPDFLNQYRLEKAKELLLTTPLPILDIAIMVGFKSQENFHRLFKKMERKTPKDWRIQAKNS